MYWLLMTFGLASGALLAWRGVRRERLGLAIGGVALGLATLLLFAGLSFWGEALWFEQVGYEDRFWTVVGARVALGATGALVASALVLALARDRWAATFGATIGAVWWSESWETVLLFWNAAPTGDQDPIFGLDLAFHLFELPFYDSLLWFLLVQTLIALLWIGARAWTLPREHTGRAGAPHARSRRLLWAGSALFLLLAARFAIAPFHLLTSQFGVVHGAGWSDVWVRRPGYYAAAAAAALMGIALLLPVLRHRLERALARLAAARPSEAPLSRQQRIEAGAATLALASAFAAIAAVWSLGVWLVPALFQWLRVEPQEVTLERPYIEYNIAHTRKGFGFERVEDQRFSTAGELTSATAHRNADILSEVRLWDPRALAAVYEQFQEIRLYYEMDSIDIDRYWLDGRYRQVMVAAREMLADSLPADSQTFVNRRFKYTHGYGLAMSPVSEFRGGGLPTMFIKDLPPQTPFDGLRIERPEIYYGEQTNEHVIVSSSEPEFDYPQGDHNVYVHYAGDGGVAISSDFRRFLFGWKFDGTRLFVSRYVTPQSRIMFHRQVRERVQTLAPFLAFDEDPYLVTEGGRLYWIIDAYTASRRYPYSEPFSGAERIAMPGARGEDADIPPALPPALRGANYVRNSVKAVVDAYDGSVDFYVFEPEDPIIAAWSHAFPGLLKARSAMPRELERHVRYPEGLLLAQARVYSKYHMTDPDVFYNQEDLWVRATENYYDRVQAVQPYYVMWQPSTPQPPGSSHAEFILMQPFTPKDRQVLIGWIAGMCDPPNYGRLLAYHFPKDTRVLGTQQVDTKIDQDRELSAQLTLWNQQGKRVIRGNVLVIPIGDTLLYVEPIYIQADVAAYPELRLVVVMHDDRMSYAPSFEQALEGLLEPAEASERQLVSGRLESDTAGGESWRSAAEALDSFLRATSEGRFADAGQHLERLRDLIEREAPE